MKILNNTVVLAVGLVVLLMAMSFIIDRLGFEAADEVANEVTVDAVSLDKVPDGTYRGEAGSPPYAYKVQVTVQDHRIRAIRLPGKQGEKIKGADKLFKRVVDAQSVEVAPVAGFPVKSKVLLKAVQRAVSRGVGAGEHAG